MNRVVAALSLLMTTLTVCGTPPKRAEFTEYDATFFADEGRQPVVTIRWWSMDVDGPYQEYPEIWRKGMRFGYGSRLRVVRLSGVDQDGKRKKGEIVVAEIEDTKTKAVFTFRSDRNESHASYSEAWVKMRVEKFPPKHEQAK